MSMQDPISDMLTQIRNAQMVFKKETTVSLSKLKLAIVNVLLDEGYITAYRVNEGAKATLTITLKYHRSKAVIDGIKRVSRPGVRIYKGYKSLPRVIGGLGVAIVSTPKGVMSSLRAIQDKLGGEVLCVVW